MDEAMLCRRAQTILEGMTLPEKIGQVTQLMYYGTNYDETVAAIREIKPGSLILAGSALAGNEKQESVQRDRLDELQELAMAEIGVPLLLGRDVIHGHHVVFPAPLTSACAFDKELVRTCYDAVREEAGKDGINWTFTPMLDMAHDPRWGRIVEGPGEDPYLGEVMAEAMIKGFQTEDLSAPDAMAACAKHYVGYGASEGGRDYNHTEISDYNLQNNYLPAFRSAVKAGVATVMSAFNELNGIPLTAHRHLLTDVLRGDLGFDGMVVSDWEAVQQLTNFAGFARDRKEAAAQALTAGVDMDMIDNCYLENVEQLLAEGTLTMAELDTAVLRILKTKLRMGLFEHPHMPRGSYDAQAHLALAQKAAEQSVVLLKNNQSLLPLSKTGSLGLAGALLHDKTELCSSWALDTREEYLRSISEAVKLAAPQATILEAQDYLTQHVTTLRDADVLVLVFGETHWDNGESRGMAEVEIPEEQQMLAQRARRMGKPVVAVLCYARPIALGNVEHLFDAILYAGHGGSRGADAIAAVLFGDAEPGGRLAFTLPHSFGQLPLYYNAPPGARRMNGYYGEDDMRMPNYVDLTGKPSYPFGYGLSYTTFAWSAPTVAAATLPLAAIEQGEGFALSVQVTNTGNRAGTAVTQLYVRDLVGSRVRPLRCLRGFDRTLLQPGETATVTFTVAKADLGFYLEDGSFVVEPGDFTLYVGENCLTDNAIDVTLTK